MTKAAQKDKTPAADAPAGAQKPVYARLMPGDPAPWFVQRACCNPSYRFDTAAGRYIVLGFIASSADPLSADALTVLETERALFDDAKVSYFNVTLDPADETEGRLVTNLPGIRHFFDFDGAVSTAYGAIPRNHAGGKNMAVRRFWLVLDPTLRVIKNIPFIDNGQHKQQLVSFLKSLPPVEKFAGLELQAPVIMLPNVFEPALCADLIKMYDAQGGVDSGFMRDVNGKTVSVTDYGHKRRSDLVLEDEDLLQILRHRIHRRIVPEIKKVHFFDVSRIERFIVACYDSSNRGFFNAHRDNTTKGTAHRRFAVTINLNNDFEGGELNFPEYGPRTFKPPVGGAVVFSCALLHAVTPVTAGRRFAFLPFLYDEAAAKVRAENQHFLNLEEKAK
ncbi:MAG: 2OG-Fe(II) oxygenase [Micavibrio sp.]|nr:2OG-Fe(II) oxygenase [Micavibrio sp.]